MRGGSWSARVAVAAAAVMWSASAHAAAGTGAVTKDVREALQKLHAADQAEIEMGHLATQHAESADVKQFAQKMIDDHSKNDEQLKRLAESHRIQLKGKDAADEEKSAQKEMKQLEGKTGEAFDRAYMSHMVSEHQKDVKELGKAVDKARGNQEIASFLEQTRSTIEGHLRRAEQVEKGEKSERAQREHAGSNSASTSTGQSGASGTGSASGSRR